MELRAACNRNFNRLTIALAVTVGSGAAYAILTRPARDPDQLWRQVQQELKAGKLDRAEADMGRLLRLRAASDEEWMVLGQLAIARGRDALALENLARISDAYPLAGKARTWEGSIALRSQLARKAEAAFLRAVRLDPHDQAPRRELILLYCMQRRRRELYDQFSALSRLTTLDFNQMLLWSSSLASSWDPSEVAPIMEAFVKADADDSVSRLTLAEALRRLRRIDDVKAVLSPLPSSDLEVRAILARIAVSRGDDKEVERLTGDDADNHPVLARMRASLALSRHDLPAACEHLRAALAADPHNRAVLFQLGENLVRCGKVEEGQRFVSAARDHDALYELIEKAEAEGGRDVQFLRSIAGASLRVGLRAEARAWYLLALWIDPASEQTQKAVYRLEHEEKGAAALSPAFERTHKPREFNLPISPSR